VKKRDGKSTVNPYMKPTERLLIHKACFDEGIIPIEVEQSDMTVALSQLPPDEARKLKRKFRKLWRREARKCNVDLKSDAWSAHYAQRTWGKSGQHPSRFQKINRKRAVLQKIRREKVNPILEKIQNPDGK
jgi:hypothetical protein